MDLLYWCSCFACATIHLAKKAVHANAVTPQQILALTQLGEKKKRCFQSIADIPKADNGTFV